MKKFILVIILCFAILGFFNLKESNHKEEIIQEETVQFDLDSLEFEKDGFGNYLSFKLLDQDGQILIDYDASKQKEYEMDHYDLFQKITTNSTYSFYVKDDIDLWIDQNIIHSLSTYQKVEKVISYCQTFSYNYFINNYRDMLKEGSGECWANTHLLITLCQRMNIPCGVRTRSNHLSYPDFHINAYVMIDGISYVVDVGHQDRNQVEFYESPGYSYEIKNDGTIKIIDFDDYANVIDIPSSIDGYTVSEIGKEAFRYHFETNEITIPDTVTFIGQRAFQQCNGLTDISLSKDCIVADDAFLVDPVTMLGNTKLWIKEGKVEQHFFYQ